ncbi:OmpA family protein [Vibrio scophthalmi]|uniref:Outer membrane protein P.III n=1 Tax=Vibrio scophthalmi TaxID=45658 RepID=A0A1E3WN03_9VIBR|nr:OmpA family protein [Vibrio scophthalmi]ODS11159.1 Outer membrane protein P.III [Vibrio scophthalmi]
MYGRLGAAYWDVDKKQNLTLKGKGMSPLGEVGVNYQLTQNVFLNAGYQYISQIGDAQMGEYGSHSIITGISYRFGGEDNTVVTAIEPVVLVEPGEELVQQEEELIVLPPPVAHVEVMESVLLTSAEFGFDKVTMSQDNAPRLTDAVQLLNTYPQARVEVIGYSDPRGSSVYNQKLSTKRAEFMVSLLEQNGIAASRIDVRGGGKSNYRPMHPRKSMQKADVWIFNYCHSSMR